MLKLSLCIDAVFPEVDFYDRIPMAASLGFEAVEFWNPVGKDLPRIAHLAASNHLAISICCARDAWIKRMDGPTEEVLANIRNSIEDARELGCSSLIVLSGDDEGNPECQKKRLAENLKRCADLAEKSGVILNLEALNTAVDHPGYFLNSSAVGFEILQSVNSDYIRLLFDVYHMQVMEGNIISSIKSNIARIGHFHSAGVPGRHELFNNELDYRTILKEIEAVGYSRYFGIEYFPSYEHHKSLVDTLHYLKS